MTDPVVFDGVANGIGHCDTAGTAAVDAAGTPPVDAATCHCATENSAAFSARVLRHKFLSMYTRMIKFLKFPCYP